MACHILSALDASCVVVARKEGRQAALSLGASKAGATLAAAVVSELARNVMQHAGSGEILIVVTDDALIVETRDRGPGIANVRLALTPGYSTDGSAGLGLFGVSKVAESLMIENGEKGGLLVRAILSARRLGADSDRNASSRWVPIPAGRVC